MSVRHDLRAMALKMATRALIESCGGTDGSGQTCDVRQQRMSDCQNVNNPDFLRINEVSALEDVSAHQPGHPHVTRALAKRQGFALVKLPDARACETKWSAFVAQLAKEGGDVMAGICGALADDNEVSPREADAVLDDVQALIDIAVQLRAALAERAGSERSGG